MMELVLWLTWLYALLAGVLYVGQAARYREEASRSWHGGAVFVLTLAADLFGLFADALDVSPQEGSRER